MEVIAPGHDLDRRLARRTGFARRGRGKERAPVDCNLPRDLGESDTVIHLLESPFECAATREVGIWDWISRPTISACSSREWARVQTADPVCSRRGKLWRNLFSATWPFSPVLSRRAFFVCFSFGSTRGRKYRLRHWMYSASRGLWRSMSPLAKSTSTRRQSLALAWQPTGSLRSAPS